jgi:hypothetical protein
VIHRRRVVFVDRRYWIVADDFRGEANHRIDLRFQFAPSSLAVERDGWIRAHSGNGHALLLKSFAGVPVEMNVLAGSESPIGGWISPDYGRRVPAPVVRCSTEVRLPLRILTLLLPLEDSSAPLPDVLPIMRDCVPAGLQFGITSEFVRLEEDRVVCGTAAAKLSR